MDQDDGVPMNPYAPQARPAQSAYDPTVRAPGPASAPLPPPTATTLAAPNMPADFGLSTLGLLMQFVGSLFAAMMGLQLFTTLVEQRGRYGDSGPGKFWMVLVLGSCIARSLAHRAAGSDLLYGAGGATTTGLLPGLKRYVVFGLIHSAFVASFLLGKMNLPAKYAIGLGLGMALWPAVLGVLYKLRLSQFESTGVPVAEDKGFEGAAIVMTLMGIAGSIISGTFLLLLLKESSKMLNSGYGMLVFAAVIMLFIRSILHVSAGTAGLRDNNVDTAVERAGRYANFGVIASFSTAGAVLLVMMSGRLQMMMLVIVMLIGWMLLIWPMIIRRFFGERQFADLMAHGEGAVHRRAPDQGLSGLGWLLVGSAVASFSMLLPQVIAGAGSGLPSQLQMIGAMFGSAEIADRSMWWSVLIAGLQLWAGLELIRMSPLHRVASMAYAILASAITIYKFFPMMKALTQITRMRNLDAMLMSTIPVVIALIVPVATIILVNRKIVPFAVARYR